MKKIIVFLLSLILCFGVVSTPVMASEAEPQLTTENTLTKDEIEEILSQGVEIINNARVTGLIRSAGIGVQKSSSGLLVVSQLICDSSVVRCGIKELVIERSTSPDSGFSEYASYSDFYIDHCEYWFTDTYQVPSGYYYRVNFTYYAKKSIWITQRIDALSDTVYI